MAEAKTKAKSKAKTEDKVKKVKPVAEKKTKVKAEVKKAKPEVKEETKETIKVELNAAGEKIYKIKKDPITAVGRRKTASARLFMYKGKGTIQVNFMDISKYFPSDGEKIDWMQPFHLVGVSHPESKFNATIKVQGSGKSGQLGAVIHAFSRALATLSEENHSILRRNGYLTRDSRMVERKKPYLRKARKAPQYSKR